MEGELKTYYIVDREVIIYLPPTYKAEIKSYPVVYIHDGSYLFKDSLIQLEAMFSNHRLKEMILVGIEPHNRLDEYTPWKASALDARLPDFNGQGAIYLKVVIDEIKMFIDKHFFTNPTAHSTGMIGASLGGLISFYSLYCYPDKMDKIALLSPSLWYKDFMQFLKITPMPSISNKKIYLYVGEKEGKDKTNIQQFMVENNKHANELLKNAGLMDNQLKFELGKNAKHNKETFKKQFLHALEWLFQKE
ncbi:alpha/beta hydrolase [Niallia nealsonii]|uniref:Esterase n=1 Tax=Niallia nealsonii TaxID=115979 RepID=A0A2N0Z7D9_9BACI|nr:alpha/beta hydrolase-fold protein [Niallia nealsonii]PKG25421.1 esterase [Niallia nealsonii]